MIIIDTIYQRVLALANKEQRGYITPLEFNLLANQAQELIFEQYFYDLDQFKRRDTDEPSFSDMVELIQNPIYAKSGYTSVAIGPSSHDIEVYDQNGQVTDPRVTCEVISRPEKVEWGYDVINERALYNASRSTNFQLHASEETELANKILGLAGIVINKPDLAQAGAALDNAKLSQEKQ